MLGTRARELLLMGAARSTSAVRPLLPRAPWRTRSMAPSVPNHDEPRGTQEQEHQDVGHHDAHDHLHEILRMPPAHQCQHGEDRDDEVEPVGEVHVLSEVLLLGKDPSHETIRAPRGTVQYRAR